ncbi:MAG: hypothetical protein ABR575_07565 [Actinomycetota bacterium]
MRARSLRVAAAVVALLAGSGVVALTASAQAPTDAQVTLEGCRGGPLTFPATGPFVCPDDLYTTGNLAADWNELDLVPHRVTFTASPGPGDSLTTVALAADYIDDGIVGYDFISIPVLNTALSTGTCSLTSGPLVKGGPSLGGADSTIYRLVTVTQGPESVCVYDYYQRLSLRSVLYPGSSLQSYVANSDLEPGGVGLRKISIPVPVLPQKATKTMTATQGLEFGWNVTKEVAPAAVAFADTCDPDGTAAGIPVTVTVSWERLDAVPGRIRLTTNIVVENPAKRPIIADITRDVIYVGTAPGTRVPIRTLGSADFGGPQEVPAGGSVTFTNITRIPLADLPPGTDLAGLVFSDDATVTYSSQVVGEDPLGSQDVSAVAPLTTDAGPAEHETAVITDVETITGDGLSFAVNGVTGAVAGSSFGGGYVPGTRTEGPVTWTSGVQSGPGTVTFAKTVYADEGAVLDDGLLADVATVANAGEVLATARGEIDIAASAFGTLTIRKTIPDVLQAGESQVFNFSVTNDATGDTVQASLVFGPGDTSLSTALTDLPLGTYRVRELTAAGFVEKETKTAVLETGTCKEGVFFRNVLSAPEARVVKITLPSGLEEGWKVRLTGPGAPRGGEVRVTNQAGIARFETPLEEGTYNVTEDLVAGWSQTSVEGDCTFTVDLPADAGRTFVCTLTNRFNRVGPGQIDRPDNKPPSVVPDVRGGVLPRTGANDPSRLLALAGALLTLGGLLTLSKRDAPAVR